MIFLWKKLKGCPKMSRKGIGAWASEGNRRVKVKTANLNRYKPGTKSSLQAWAGRFRPVRSTDRCAESHRASIKKLHLQDSRYSNFKTCRFAKLYHFIIKNLPAFSLTDDDQKMSYCPFIISENLRLNFLSMYFISNSRSNFTFRSVV